MSKYGNRITYLDGHQFDSLAERRRYVELKLLEASGTISGLSVHPVFELQPAFNCRWQRISAVKYEGDFSYFENGQSVVEDVKGAETEAFKIKRRLFLMRYPSVELRIIKG